MSKVECHMSQPMLTYPYHFQANQNWCDDPFKIGDTYVTLSIFAAEKYPEEFRVSIVDLTGPGSPQFPLTRRMLQQIL
jgi:hypothetical protein